MALSVMVANGEEALDLLRRMTGKPPGVRLLRKTTQNMPGFKAVQIDKRQVKCACVGGAIIVPLGIVPLTEHQMMVAMVIRMPIRMLWPGDMRLCDERQPSWPVPTTTLAGGAERKTGMPVWRAAPPA